MGGFLLAVCDGEEGFRLFDGADSGEESHGAQGQVDPVEQGGDVGAALDDEVGGAVVERVKDLLVGGFFVEGFGDSPALVFLAYSGGAAPVGEDAGQGGFFEFVGSVVERIDGDAIVGGFNEFLPDVQGDVGDILFLDAGEHSGNGLVPGLLLLDQGVWCVSHEWVPLPF